jgi:hypothetical protein
MFICPKKQFVYVTVPKAASVAIIAFLQQHFTGIHHKGHPTDIPASCRRYYTFTVVRNPYLRAVSIWRWLNFTKVIREPVKHIDYSNWYTFLQKMINKDDYAITQTVPAMRTQATHLHGTRIDCAIHLNNVEQRLAELSFMPNNISLPVLNKAPVEYDPYKFLDERAMLLIEKWMSNDFKQFCFHKGVLPK